MIRVLLFLVFVALAACGVAWIADRPGDIAITWQGWRIETSVMVAVVAVAALVALCVLLWSLLRTILRSPDLLATFLNHRRGVRGYLAISRGLIAVGAGDARSARHAADEAARIAPGQPLTLLLDAQCAQIAGDRAAAETAFRAMAERDDTRLLGLRGLFIEAQRRGDVAAARGFAEQAASAAPSTGWAGQAALEFRCAAGDWAAALAALDQNYRYDLVDKPTYRRHRAVLLTAQALAAADSDRDRARGLALDAVKLAPDLVPAAELAGRLLGENNELRRAARIVEQAWQDNPHPDLADTYAHLRPGDSARERLARVQTLARKTPGHAEGALAVARVALDAQEFAVARDAIKPLLKAPTQRVAALMAEIEQRESNNEGRAREWMARALRAPRDPAWTADGFVSDRWMPVSPVSGRLDAFQWKVPLAELSGSHPVIDVDDEMTVAEPAVLAPPEEPRVDASAAIAPAPPPKPVAPAQPPAPVTPAPARQAEPVIPLTHVPDDPGPEPAADLDPEAGPVPAGARGGLGLFK
jgi:HemY protein